MLVFDSVTGDQSVHCVKSRSIKLVNKLSILAAGYYKSLMKTGNKILHSPAIFSCGIVKLINSFHCDVVNLHWTQQEMLSISDISKINKPLVWSLHDMWPFCGAEHYSNDDRYVHGYTKKNRPPSDSGIDLNRITWLLKRHYWKNAINIVANSHWMHECASKSLIMKNWPIKTIHYPLDLHKWCPVTQKSARVILGLPAESPLILFGAMEGERDPRKGADLLSRALKQLDFPAGRKPALAIFGQSRPIISSFPDYKTYYFGHLFDDFSLKLLYSAADVMVVPSRQEAFGQTASEAQACGTPVVSFRIGGLQDTIDHLVTGYLAKPFCTQDLANGILQMLLPSDSLSLRQASRMRASSLFNYERVSKEYLSAYTDITRTYQC
jgi:glycosyltransferase involved in cell wall biosynthesis